MRLRSSFEGYAVFSIIRGTKRKSNEFFRTVPCQIHESWPIMFLYFDEPNARKEGFVNMKRTEIAAVYADGEALSGQEITVCGWVRTIRDMKTFGFIELNDGSCFKNLQVVFEDGTVDNYREIAKLNVGSSLIVRGTVKLTPEAKQPLELTALNIAVEGPSTPEYPLQKKRHTVEYLRTIAHLRPRTNLFSAVSACAPWRRWRCMNFSRSVALCMCIRP